MSYWAQYTMSIAEQLAEKAKISCIAEYEDSANSAARSIEALLRGDEKWPEATVLWDDSYTTVTISLSGNSTLSIYDQGGVRALVSKLKEMGFKKGDHSFGFSGGLNFIELIVMDPREFTEQHPENDRS